MTVEGGSVPVRAARVLAWLALIATALAVPYAFAWRSTQGLLAIALLGTAIWLAIAASRPIWMGGLARVLAAWEGPRFEPARALTLIVVVGLALRILWVAAFPPVQVSDYAQYWALAERLASDGVYAQTIGEHMVRAWRPPGYPMLLAGLIAVVGPWTWLALAVNLVVHALATVLVYRIGRDLADPATGLLAALVLALWPSYLAQAGFAGTEPVSLLVLVALALGALRLARPAPPSGLGLVFGLIAGAGALIRPPFLLAPLMLPIVVGLSARLDRRHAAAFLLALVGTALVIAPWTIRNRLVLGHWVTISTNSGDILYRANNPRATGGFTPVGERDTRALLVDEVRWDRENRALALAWIGSNPDRFAILAVQKAGIFLGTDETGAFWSLKPGRDAVEVEESAWVVGSNVYWLMVWGVLGIALAFRRRAFLAVPALLPLAAFTLLLLPVHMVFESQPRYHVPMIGLLAVLVAVGVRALAGPPRAAINQTLPGDRRG